MSVKAERLKGFLLEETLVYLLRNAGFVLLTDPERDPAALEWRGGSLAVKGKGAAHQADVLGELAWVTAFALPVRLWLEAKFRAGRVGIEEVRNAVGVLQDVNDDGGYRRGQPPVTRHRYVYVLFSAAGFTRPAAELALAHQISLVDLSGGDYDGLLAAIDRTAEVLAANTARLRREELLFAAPESGLVGDNAVAAMRRAMRAALGTAPGGGSGGDGADRAGLAALLAPVTAAARECDELFVAMANGPYMVLLKADNVAAFRDRLAAGGGEPVAMAWNRRSDGLRTWTVRPHDEGFRLSFRLPDPFAAYVLEAPAAGAPASLAVYRRAEGREQIFRLEYG
jgi:hypothetical protein